MTQQQINGLADQTQTLLSQYLTDEQQVNQLKKYNANLQALVNDQQNKIASLNLQLSQIGDVGQGIVPLMEQMIAGLKSFIQLDVPFQLDQRQQAVQTLEDLMTNSDVQISEKYSQITSAYLDELDSGRTVDSYQAQLSVNGKTQTVNMLRVGRIVLCYQTLDQSQTGCWNQRTRQWQANGNYRQPVTTAIAVALKQQQPNLLTLPVVAPEPAPPEAKIIPAPQTTAAPSSQAQPAMPSQTRSAPAPQTH